VLLLFCKPGNVLVFNRNVVDENHQSYILTNFSQVTAAVSQVLLGGPEKGACSEKLSLFESMCSGS